MQAPSSTAMDSISTAMAALREAPGHSMGLNIIAPGMVINIHTQGPQSDHHGNPNPQENGDGQVQNYQLNLSELPLEAISAIGRQLCLTCSARYDSGLEPAELPCGHQFCASCIRAEMKRQRDQVAKNELEQSHEDDLVEITGPPHKATIKPTVFNVDSATPLRSKARPGLAKVSELQVATAKPITVTVTCPLCKEPHDASHW